MLTVEKRIISRNFTRAGAGRKIEYIVIHYFGSLARRRRWRTTSPEPIGKPRRITV